MGNKQPVIEQKDVEKEVNTPRDSQKELNKGTIRRKMSTPRFSDCKSIALVMENREQERINYVISTLKIPGCVAPLDSKFAIDYCSNKYDMVIYILEMKDPKKGTNPYNNPRKICTSNGKVCLIILSGYSMKNKHKKCYEDLFDKVDILIVPWLCM